MPSTIHRAIAGSLLCLTMHNQKLALVAPQKQINNQAECKSGTAGIRWNNNRCSLDFAFNWAITYSELPIGAPNTRTPLS